MIAISLVFDRRWPQRRVNDLIAIRSWSRQALHTWKQYSTNSRSTVSNFHNTEFFFQKSKALGILQKSVQTFVICRRSPTNIAVSRHF